MLPTEYVILLWQYIVPAAAVVSVGTERAPRGGALALALYTAGGVTSSSSHYVTTTLVLNVDVLYHLLCKKVLY